MWQSLAVKQWADGRARLDCESLMQIQPTTEQLQSRRKTPRVGLAFDSRFLRPLLGVQILWEDRSVSSVYDLSLTGLVLEKTGVLKEILQKAKPGALFSVKMRFDGDQQLGLAEERMTLDLRVVEIGASYVSAMIDSIGSDGRLKLPQNLKDLFVIRNLTRQASEEQMRRLHPDFSGYKWYHSAFDTNIVIKLHEGQIQSLMLEYDTLLLRYNAETGIEIQKSFAMADLGQGYSHLWLSQQSQKVAMGASWPERLGRVLEQANTASAEMTNDLRHVQNFLTAVRNS